MTVVNEGKLYDIIQDFESGELAKINWGAVRSERYISSFKFGYNVNVSIGAGVTKRIGSVRVAEYSLADDIIGFQVDAEKVLIIRNSKSDTATIFELNVDGTTTAEIPIGKQFISGDNIPLLMDAGNMNVIIKGDSVFKYEFGSPAVITDIANVDTLGASAISKPNVWVEGNKFILDNATLASQMRFTVNFNDQFTGGFAERPRSSHPSRINFSKVTYADTLQPVVLSNVTLYDYNKKTYYSGATVSIRFPQWRNVDISDYIVADGDSLFFGEGEFEYYVVGSHSDGFTVPTSVRLNGVILSRAGDYTVTGTPQVNEYAGVKTQYAAFLDQRLFFTWKNKLFYSEIGNYSNFGQSPGTAPTNVLLLPTEDKIVSMTQGVEGIFVATKSDIWEIIPARDTVGTGINFRFIKIGELPIIENGIVNAYGYTYFVTKSAVFRYNPSPRETYFLFNLTNVSAYFSHIFDVPIVSVTQPEYFDKSVFYIIRGNGSIIRLQIKVGGNLAVTRWRLGFFNNFLPGGAVFYSAIFNNNYVVNYLPPQRYLIDNYDENTDDYIRNLDNYVYLDSAYYIRSVVFGDLVLKPDNTADFRGIYKTYDRSQGSVGGKASVVSPGDAVYISDVTNHYSFKMRVKSVAEGTKITFEPTDKIPTNFNFSLDAIGRNAILKGVEMSPPQPIIDKYRLEEGIFAVIHNGKSFVTGKLSDFPDSMLKGTQITFGYPYESYISLLCGNLGTEQLRYRMKIQTFDTSEIEVRTKYRNEIKKVKTKLLPSNVESNIIDFERLGNMFYSNYTLEFGFANGVFGSILSVNFEVGI